MKIQRFALMALLVVASTPMMAQDGQLQEIFYPNCGIVYPKYPHFDLIFGQDPAVMQKPDSLNPMLWLNDTRFATSKDANGKYTKFDSRRWDAANSKWVLETRIDYKYTYNANQKMTGYRRDQTITDTLSVSEDMTYSNSGPNTSPSVGSATDSIHSGSLSVAYGMRADSFTYQSGNLVSYRSWMIQGSSPNLDQAYDYTYDANGRAVSMTALEDNGSGTIDPTKMVMFTYDANGNITSQLTLEYNSVGKFDSSTKETYSYVTGTGRMSQMIEYEWQNGTMVKLNTTDFHYNSNNQLDSAEIIAHTSADKNQRGICIYNGTTPTMLTIYEWDGNNWVNHERYLFSDPVIGVVELAKQNHVVALYPNPSTGILSVDPMLIHSTTTLRDLSGKTVFSGIPDASGKLDVSQLTSGIYFYSVSDGQSSILGKIVIQ